MLVQFGEENNPDIISFARKILWVYYYLKRLEFELVTDHKFDTTEYKVREKIAMLKY